MISPSKKTTIKWLVAALALTLVIGCSNSNNPVNKSNTSTIGQSNDGKVPSSTNATGGPDNSSQNSSNDPAKTFLLNMMQLAQHGKVINCDFPVKTTVFEDVQKVWGQAAATNYVAAAKGRYATYPSRNIVFGINKGEQIFEVRSLARSQFTSLSLTKVKEVFGPPVYEAKADGQEIIGYTAGPEFKIELVFPQAKTGSTNPSLDHYNVLYPQGTVNMMADDPGRQW
ncbi:MAG: YjgB family protein [Bacillota bacterium]|nr:YjgB family protein [Bacillota bacterium]